MATATSLIPDEHKEHLRAELNEKLDKPVKIMVFTQEMECQFCRETTQLAYELAALHDKITLEVYEFVKDADKARQYGVDKIPAVAIIGEKDYGVRFYGFPFGYELQTIIEAIVNVSTGKTDFPDKVKEMIKDVKTPIHIQVLVTLTCPHCPIVASMAHKFAIENDMIRADIIDASEFPHIATKYNLLGVPKTIINEKVEFLGPLPEDLFLEHIILATAQAPVSA